MILRIKGLKTQKFLLNFLCLNVSRNTFISHDNDIITRELLTNITRVPVSFIKKFKENINMQINAVNLSFLELSDVFIHVGETLNL